MLSWRASIGEKWGKNSIEMLDDISVWYDGFESLFLLQRLVCPEKAVGNPSVTKVGYIDQYFLSILEAVLTRLWWRRKQCSNHDMPITAIAARNASGFYVIGWFFQRVPRLSLDLERLFVTLYRRKERQRSQRPYFLLPREWQCSFIIFSLSVKKYTVTTWKYEYKMSTL